MPTRITIVGPGAIGQLFGSALVTSGCDVTFLARSARRAARLTDRGLRIQCGDAPLRTVPARATADPAALPIADLAFICTKAYDTARAIADVGPGLGPNTIVVSLQNGAGNAETIAGTVPARQVICAVTFRGATLDPDGQVTEAGEGVTVVAPFDKDMAAATRVGDCLRAAGFTTRVETSAETVVWSKLVLNAALNPVSALWELHNGDILAHPEAGPVALAALHEAETVARASGIDLSYPCAEAAFREVCRRTATNRASMWEDLQRGRRTEIDAINGVILRQAERVALDTPTHARLYSEVRARDGSPRTVRPTPTT